MRRLGIKQAIITTVILIICLSHGKIMSFASAKDDYIIVAKDNSAYNNVVDDYEKKMVSDENGLLKEQETAVMYISEWEANKLEKDEGIICIEPIVDVAATGIMNNSVSNYADEWNLAMINADNVSKRNNGNTVKVAILDSGIDYNENINVVKRKNFIEEYDSMDLLFEDTTGHGTSVASIMSAAYNNETSVKGINPDIEIYSAKILDENNVAPMDRVIESIYWAIEEDVDIISISFGTDMYSEALEIAIKEAYEKGILIVAAAGNEYVDKIQYPAAFDEVVAVGGVDSKGNISKFSSTSNKIDVYAPGEQVKAIGAFNGEVVVSGTSIAVPHVVGVASVLINEDNTKSNEFIKQLIVESANKSNSLNGAGIVDLEYALNVYNDFELTSQEVSNNIVNKTQLYVNNDINYVTGSWGIKAHQTSVTSSNKISKLSSSEIAILKWGAVYSDKSSNFKGMTSNPYFHGYSKKSNINKNYNYLAGYIYLTRCALNGGYNQSKDGITNTSGNIAEMDQKLQLINFGGKEIISGNTVSILQGNSNTKKNRSLFYLGMAMHTAADIYAHSSYSYHNGKWVYISHSSTEITESDNVNYRPKRYEAAKEVVSKILDNYLNGKEGSVKDFVLSDKYYDGSFKIRKMYDYSKEIESLDSNSAKVLQNITYGYKPETEKMENETKVEGQDTAKEDTTTDTEVENQEQANTNNEVVQNQEQANTNNEVVENQEQANTNNEIVENQEQANTTDAEVENQEQANTTAEAVQNQEQTNVTAEAVQNQEQTNVTYEVVQNQEQTNVTYEVVQNQEQTNTNNVEVQNQEQTNTNNVEVENQEQANTNNVEVQNQEQANTNDAIVQNQEQINTNNNEVQDCEVSIDEKSINQEYLTGSNEEMPEKEDNTVFVNENVEENLEQNLDNLADTGDNTNIVKILFVMLISLIVVTYGFLRYLKKDKKYI